MDVSDMMSDLEDTFEIDIDGWTTEATHMQTYVSKGFWEVLDAFLEENVPHDEIVICRVNGGEWDVIA